MTNEPCPIRSERHRKRRLQVKALRISRYANPKYHYRKIVEDIRSARAGLKMWQLDQCQTEATLRQSIRGKLFATYIAGAAFAGTGPWLGYLYQITTGNAFIGVVIGVMWANVMGLLAFQVIWSITNKEFYARRHATFFDRWRALLHDLWPMQWKSIQIALLMNAIMLPIAKLVVMLLEHAGPNVVRYVPVSFFVSLTEAVIIQSTMLRLMGDLFERHARVLGKRYAPSLRSAE